MPAAFIGVSILGADCSHPSGGVMVIRWIILVIVGLSSVTARADTDEWAKGVANFLVDRANANYLYIFESQLKEDKYFACYFPDTVEVLNVGGLRELISAKDIWRATLKSDMKTLSVRLMINEFEKIYFENDIIAWMRLYEKFLSDMSVKLNNDIYGLTIMNVGSAHVNVSKAIQSIRENTSVISKNADSVKEYVALCDDTGEIGNEQKLDDYLSFIARIVSFEIDVILKETKTIGKILHRYREDFVYTGKGSLADICTDTGVDVVHCRTEKELLDYMSTLKSAVTNDAIDDLQKNVANYLVKIQAVIGEVDLHISGDDAHRKSGDDKRPVNVDDTRPKDSTTAQNAEDTGDWSATLFAYQKIKDFKKEGVFRGDDNALGRISRNILFFAQIADATTADEVSNILISYTLPAVSFYAKRERRWHYFISSYLGYSYGKVSNESGAVGSNREGIFAPIGVEIGRGFSFGSLSILVSPMDFGYPVSLKLNGLEEGIAFKELVAPSVTLTWGVPRLPIVVGAILQKGRGSVGETGAVVGATEDRYMAFIGFDMPLFSIK